MKKITGFFRHLDSRLVTVLAVSTFVVLAARIAFTRNFPLPYDEGFHFGLIQLYTHHLSPLLSHQPAGADAYGAVARDPSYVYHYLMSFPLRAISLFTHATIAQVIALRVLNIALGVSTLLLIKKLAIRLGASKVMANTSLLALAVTPVFYDLSAQINYDNLLIPLSVISLLVAWNAVSYINKGLVPLAKLMQLMALLLLTSLVQYSFLPIMVTIGIYVIGKLVLAWRGSVIEWNVKWNSVVVIVSALVMVTSIGLWIQRDGVNVALYGTPHPQCNTVMSVQACSAYSPWYRNYQLHQTYDNHPSDGLQLVSFTKTWTRAMLYGTFSTVSSHNNTVIFTPVNMTRIMAKFVFLGALVYGLIRWTRVRGSSIPWVLLGSVMAAYVVTLFGQNFGDFHHLGALVAIQGRYILPILPLVYAVIARMSTLMVDDLRPSHLRMILAEYATVGLVTEDAVIKWVQRPIHAIQVIRQARRLRTYP